MIVRNLEDVVCGAQRGDSNLYFTLVNINGVDKILGTPPSIYNVYNILKNDIALKAFFQKKIFLSDNTSIILPNERVNHTEKISTFHGSIPCAYFIFWTCLRKTSSGEEEGGREERNLITSGSLKWEWQLGQTVFPADPLCFGFISD